MASLTGNLVAETYKALLKTIDNDILTASEKQITDGLGGGSNVFIDSQGFLRANKYKVTNGLATQFLKADGSLDANTYLTSITSAQVIAALGYTPVTNQRTLTINGVGYNLTADRSWTIEGTAAVWGNITGTLSNQTDLQAALNAKYDDPTGTISQYIRGDGTIADFPAVTGFVPYTGATEDVDLGDYALFAHDLEIDHGSSSGTAVNIIKGGSGIAVNIIKTGSGEALTVVKSSGSGNAASITGGVTLISELHLTTDLADAYIASAATWNAKQNALSGTGFVKISGTTISYDNSTYLTTADAASTYQLLTNLSTDLTASATKYPSVNAVVAGLATKQNQLDGTGLVRMDGTTVSYDNNPYPSGSGSVGYISKWNTTTGLGNSSIYESSGSIGLNTTNTNYSAYGRAFTGGSFATSSFGYEIASGVTAAGGLLGGLAYVLISNDASRRIGAKIESNVVGSTATNLGADLRFYAKADNAAIGEIARMTASGITFYADLTATNITATAFIKSGGLSNEFLMADGSVTTYTNPVTGTGSAGYIPKWTTAANIGSSNIYDDGTSIGIAYSTPNKGGYGRTLTGAAFGSASFGFEAVGGTTTNGGLVGGLSFILSQNDSSRIVGSAIQSNLVGTTATNYGADLRFYAKADAGVIGEVARMTSAGLRVYGTIIKDGGTSSQYLMADGSVTTSVSVAWSAITGKPTTLSGYGITDAANINGDTTKQFNVFELSYANTAFNPSAAARTTIDSNSVKMWTNYFYGIGLGSDYGTVMQYYSQAGHVESQVYFDASGGSWYRTASFNANYGGWQRYITDGNISSYALPLSGGTLTGKLQINANYAGTNPERFTIRGTYPSIGLRSTNSDSNWLIHNEGNLAFYYATGVDSDTWGRRMYLDTSGTLRLMDHIVLTAGNYTSYAPSLTGYGASGTWGIDISGASNRTYRGIIQDTRSGQRTPNDYEDYRVSWEFTNQIVSGWHTVTTMQGWHDGYAAWQIIGPADGSAHENWYLRSGVNTTWNSLRTIIHSGNIGAQSVTYADNAGAVGTVGESRIVYGENSTATTSISNATLDGALKSGFYTVGSGGIPNATGVNFVLHTAYAGVGNLAGFDLACNDSTTSQFYLRPATGGGKGAWQTIITSATIGSQSVSYSNTAGLLNSLGNYVWDAASGASSYHLGISASFVRSENGFPSYGSVMTVKTYSGSMGSLQLYTPYSPTYGGYRLRYRSSNYDTGTWDGWKDLLNSANDPYAYNMNQYVRTTDDVTFSNVYANSWFRSNTNNTGLYSQANNIHFYATSDRYWNIGSGGGANGGLVFRQDHQTTLKGYVYWDGDGFGLLNNQGGWSVRAFQGTGYGGELRGTWYTGDLIVGTGGSSTITMKDSDEGNREIHCNSNRIGFLNQSSSWGAWCNDDGSWEATTMYSYNGLVNNQAVSTNTTFGMFFDSGMSTAYAIYREAGGWSHPYPDLRIAFHTGISLGANPSYGGIRFFDDYQMNTVVLYVNNAYYGGAGNVYATGTISASAFYETSDMRLKKLIDGSAQIEGIEKLEAKLYEKDGKIELGYFAQDAELIMPYAITKNADGFMNLSYREVHTAKIARLEQRVAELEKQLNLN